MSLNISDFSLFFMWKLQPPPWKKSPPLSRERPLKVEVLWLEAQPPPPSPLQKGGGCTLCGSWDIRHSRQSFLSFWAIFWPLTLLKTWNKQKKKKWKNRLEISFYTCLPQMSIIWCTVPEVWNTTDGIFSHFGQF